MNLREELTKHLGHDDFRPNQREIIKSVLKGVNTMGILPTGLGKSATFQLPALMLDGTALVVSPLIALMKDQADKMPEQAVFINSSMTNAEKLKAEKLIQTGNIKMLYVAPESLTNEFVRDQIKWIERKGGMISFVAIDEAHTVSSWGADFRTKYQRIIPMVKGLLERIPTILALTATATKRVQEDVVSNLGIEKVIRAPYERPNLSYHIRDKVSPGMAQKNILKLLKSDYKGQTGIIYCFTRRDTEEVAGFLKKNKIKAEAYHAGPSIGRKKRTEIQNRYDNGDIDVIVSTIAWGMGMDRADVRFVIHYSVSSSPENYLQETGRAGRDGLPSDCILFYRSEDISKMRWVVGKKTNGSHNPQRLLDEIQNIAEKAAKGKNFEELLVNYIDG